MSVKEEVLKRNVGRQDRILTFDRTWRLVWIYRISLRPDWIDRPVECRWRQNAGV